MAIPKCAALLLVLTSLPAFAGEGSTPTITLDRPAHFTAPDNSDVQIPSGPYYVEQAEHLQLRLTPVGGEPSVQVQASAIAHDETLGSPMTIAVIEDGRDDVLHLVLLKPDGQGLDATGSFSGVRSRAAIPLTLNRTQVQSAVSQIVAPQPAASVRVPPAQTAQGAKPALPPGLMEDTGWVAIPRPFMGPVTWGYLRMNTPNAIIGMIQEAQAGRMNPNLLQGLATPDTIKALLATKFDSQLPPPTGPNPTPQSAPLALKPSALMVQPMKDWGAILDQSQKGSSLQISAGNLTMPLVVKDFIPQQLALGDLWDGQTRRGTVRITSPREGLVTPTLPTNTPFHLVEIAAATGVFQQSSIFLGTSTPTVTPQKGTVSTSSVYVKAGQDVIITVEFAPHFDLFKQTAGNYQTTLSVSGQHWFASVPVSGFFEGIQIGVIPALDSPEVDIVNTNYADAHCGYAIPQSLTLINVDAQPHTVTVTPNNFPDQFSFNPITVSLGPRQTQKVPLAIMLHCAANYSSNQYFYLSFTISYLGIERHTGFTVEVIPPLYSANPQGDLGSCHYQIFLTVAPNGYQYLDAYSFNNNLVFPRTYDVLLFFFGNKSGELTLDMSPDSGSNNHYGITLQPLAEKYSLLFGQGAQFQMRCYSRGPL
jgi:hypothetical protein